jgi:heat shock protein HslJ
MKKLFMVLAATVICGACLFTSCKKDNLNLEEKIIGKWMPADIDGQPVLTDKKSVYTFVSASKAYMSVSTNPQQGEGTVWNDQKELDVAISGNTMTLTNLSDEHTTMVEEFTVTAINGSEFTANHKLTVKVDGSVVLSNEGVIRFVKTTADYSAAILGTWECQGLTGIETYNDANARLEFFADGTYNYWRKNNAGEWEAVTNREFQNYFVDGTLLATRWKNIGEDELREWWEIASIANGQMQWTALRQNPDGTTVQQGMKWVKVN